MSSSREPPWCANTKCFAVGRRNGSWPRTPLPTLPTQRQLQQPQQRRLNRRRRQSGICASTTLQRRASWRSHLATSRSPTRGSRTCSIWRSRATCRALTHPPTRTHAHPRAPTRTHSHPHIWPLASAPHPRCCTVTPLRRRTSAPLRRCRCAQWHGFLREQLPSPRGDEGEEGEGRSGSPLEPRDKEFASAFVGGLRLLKETGSSAGHVGGLGGGVAPYTKVRRVPRAPCRAPRAARRRIPPPHCAPPHRAPPSRAAASRAAACMRIEPPPMPSLWSVVRGLPMAASPPRRGGAACVWACVWEGCIVALTETK